MVYQTSSAAGLMHIQSCAWPPSALHVSAGFAVEGMGLKSASFRVELEGFQFAGGSGFSGQRGAVSWFGRIKGLQGPGWPAGLLV